MRCCNRSKNLIWFIFWKKIKLSSNNSWTNKYADVFCLLSNFVFFRLSAYAGEKLRLNNPGLADLSDENRPNKLAEKFSELYDNAWTDALESLADTNQNEESQIQYLLQTLRVIIQNQRSSGNSTLNIPI